MGRGKRDQSAFQPADALALVGCTHMPRTARAGQAQSVPGDRCCTPTRWRAFSSAEGTGQAGVLDESAPPGQARSRSYRERTVEPQVLRFAGSQSAADTRASNAGTVIDRIGYTVFSRYLLSQVLLGGRS